MAPLTRVSDVGRICPVIYPGGNISTQDNASSTLERLHYMGQYSRSIGDGPTYQNKQPWCGYQLEETSQVDANRNNPNVIN